MKNKCKFRFLLLYMTVPVWLFSQTKNPDISVITDFRAFFHNNQAAPSEKNALNLDLHEMEVAIQGYLNPYARADIFIAKHGVDGPIEIEEAYATFLRGLPFGLNIKAGKYLLDFSKLNSLHPHAYYFIDRPLIHTIFFGEDGFNDTGINANILLPTGDIYTNFSFNILKGDFLKAHSHEEESLDHSEEDENEHQPLAYSGRLTGHFQLSDYSNLEIGLSGVTGIYAVHENFRMYLGGLDLKYKWKPNRYQSFIFQTEALLSRREMFFNHQTDVIMGQDAFKTTTITTSGFFGSVNYQFKQRWNIGLLGEWTQAPDSKEDKYWGAGVFAGFAPMEETSVIRLLLKQEKQPGFDSYGKILAQLLFSLGPHKPHVF